MVTRSIPARSRIRTFRFWATVSVLLLVASTVASAVIAKVERDSVTSDGAVVRNVLRPARTAEAELLTAFVNQETGQRGYLLTGDKSFLQPYDMGRSSARALEQQLSTLTADDAASRTHLQAVIDAGSRWQTRAAEPEIAARSHGPLPTNGLIGLTRTGRDLFDALRARFDALIARTESLITAALRRVGNTQHDASTATNATLIGSIVIAVIALLGLRYLFARPLGRFLRQVQLIAGGDYTAPIETRGPMEFKVVADAVDTMRDGILATNADAAASQERLSLREERDRLAAELHDRTIQRVFGLGLALDAMKNTPTRSAGDMQLLVDETDRIIRELRSLIFAIGQDENSEGLRASVVNLVNDSRRGLGFLPHLDLRGPLDTMVPDDVGAELLSVLREALSNVAKHANASAATVSIAYDDESLRLEVADDGTGIAPNVRPGGGMNNLRRRAKRLAGTSSVLPGDEGGTVVTWQVPITSP